ncbi:hypothetical protein [Algibacter luteus]|uniref:hypothetical protein n=1 Tax=Algibacter luteus TaxID=1178825 RepID=UPI0025928FFC|nr:hypothetical protein [Algibacter luteus]WJJ96339.1 hypothetical protein O5O44_14085 [Algibacter luteus]
MKTKIRNRPIFFLLEESIFNRLKKEVKLNNLIHLKGKKRIKLDIACYFIHLISYQEAQAKDKADNGFVFLNAKILQKRHHNYKVYFDFLIEKAFIEFRTYSIKKKVSKSFKIIKPKTRHYKFVKYDPESFVFKRNLKKGYDARVKKADKSCKHLTKWLCPEYLSVDYDNAIDYVNSVKMEDSKKHQRRWMIEMLNEGFIYYQRQGKDNRLHSILTNMPKDLRPFLRLKNETMVSLDIKASQPYLYTGLLKLIFLDRDETHIDNYLSTIVKKDICEVIKDVIVTVMIKESLKSVDFKEIEDFIYLIENEDIYSYIGANFSEEFLYSIQTPLGISDKFYNKKSSCKVTKPFNTIRDYCKAVMLEFLYCSNGNKEARYNELKRILPNKIFELSEKLKSKEKSMFPIFLQNIEANLIIDQITKGIALKNPEIPMFTIHDSIATTHEYAGLIKEELTNQLFEFNGIKPQITIEVW